MHLVSSVCPGNSELFLVVGISSGLYFWRQHSCNILISAVSVAGAEVSTACIMVIHEPSSTKHEVLNDQTAFILL